MVAVSPTNCPADVLSRLAFSVVPLSELHRRSHARAEVFFFLTRRTGALLGKMSCQDANLEIEDPDAYYAAHYAPPLGV